MNRRGILLLTGVPDDYQGPTLSNPWSVVQRGPVEPAGHHYEKLLNKRLNIRETEDETEEVSEVEEKIGLTEAEKKKYEQKRKKNNNALHTEDDPYELLNLGHLRYRASEDDIKTAYKKMSLKYHPDKNRGVVVNEEIFKKINDAYTLLNDKKKRIVFDSEEEFNHTIPTGNEKGDFFEIYGPMFDKFSKWSVTPKVPLLGTPSTPYSQVKDFYDFWFSFKSWRDYSFKDEFNTSDAESREEKRWMERQNERERKKRKQEEFSIIFKLTEMAEKLDPRIKQYKESLKQEKERKKQEKAEAIRKKQEESDRAKLEEAEKKKEEERKRNEEIAMKKKQKEEEMKQILEIKDKIKDILKPFVPSIDDLDILCTKFNLNNKINDFVASLEKSNNKEQYFTETVQSLIKEEEEKAKQQREAKLKEKESKKNTGAPWSEEELSLLAQGIAKFPGGTTERWEKISNFIGTRTPKEIIAKTKETSTIKNKPTELVDPFARFNKTKKKADREITAEVSQRDDGASTTTTTAASTTPEAIDPSKWTAEEQKLLEKALQTYPASLGDRWDKIAAAIPGKTKKDAIARYKYIVNLVKEKQKNKQ